MDNKDSAAAARGCSSCGLLYKHSMTCPLGDGKFNSASVLDAQKDSAASEGVPERIWLRADGWVSDKDASDFDKGQGQTEYIRADLVRVRSVDEVAVRRAVDKIFGHGLIDDEADIKDRVFTIISTELKNSDSGKVGSTPLADLLLTVGDLQIDSNYSGHYQNGFEMAKTRVQEHIKKMIAMKQTTSLADVERSPRSAQAEGLLPCPFCGGAGEMDDSDLPDSLSIFCSNPQCSVNDAHIDINTWNTRSSDASKEYVRGLKMASPLTHHTPALTAVRGE